MKRYKPYYARSILTDKALEVNKPDMVLWDIEKIKVFIIDVAVPNTHDIMENIAGKLRI